MNCASKKQKQNGFTLIELLVALVIISISLLALGAFTLAVLSSDNVARQRTVATHLAEQEMERWFSGATPQTLFGVGATPGGCPAFDQPYIPTPGCYVWPKTVNNTIYKLETFDIVPVSGVAAAAPNVPPNTLLVDVNNTLSQARAVTVYWQLKGTQKSVTINHLQRTL